MPRSRLVLKWKYLREEATRRRFIEAFATQGIAADRLDLRGASPHRDMQAEYGDIDIALDPVRCGSGLASCEALWMGVPAISLPGNRPASRQTVGFLDHLGLTDLVAASPEAYVDRAASLASDRVRLADLRHTLRPRMAHSPLCDGAKFTAVLEEAYRAMWRRYCSGEPAAPFDVSADARAKKSQS